VQAQACRCRAGTKPSLQPPSLLCAHCRNAAGRRVTGRRLRQGGLLAQPGALLPGGPWAAPLVPGEEAARWLAGLPKLLWQLGGSQPAVSRAALRLLLDAARYAPRGAPAQHDPAPSPTAARVVAPPENPVAAALGALQPQLAVLLAAPLPAAAKRARAGGEARPGSKRARAAAGGGAPAAPADAPARAHGAARQRAPPPPGGAAAGAAAPRPRGAGAGGAERGRSATAAAGADGAAGAQGRDSNAGGGGRRPGPAEAAARGRAMLPGPLAQLPTECQVRPARRARARFSAVGPAFPIHVRALSCVLSASMHQ